MEKESKDEFYKIFGRKLNHKNKSQFYIDGKSVDKEMYFRDLEAFRISSFQMMLQDSKILKAKILQFLRIRIPQN